MKQIGNLIRRQGLVGSMVVTLSLVVGCGSSDEGRGGGGGGGIGGGGGGGGGGDEVIYVTVEDAAIDIGDAFCSYLLDCGEILSFEFDDCMDLFIEAVCEQVDCARAPSGSDDEIADCMFAYDRHPCGADDSPPECRRIL